MSSRKNQSFFEFKSIDAWITNELVNYIPAKELTDPLLIEKNLRRAVSLSEKLLIRRGNLNQLFSTNFHRTISREIENSEIKTQQAVALNQLQVEESETLRAHHEEASNDFKSISSKDYLATGLSKTARGIADHASIRKIKDSGTKEKINEYYDFLTSSIKARKEYEDDSESPANLEREVERNAPFHLQEVKELISLYHALTDGMKLREFANLPELAFEYDDDLIWKISRGLKICSRWLEVESRFREEATITIPLKPYNYPGPPEYPFAPPELPSGGLHTDILNLNYQDFVAKLTNGEEFDFEIDAPQLFPELTRIRPLSIGISINIISGPQSNSSTRLSAQQEQDRDSGLKLLLPIRVRAYVAPPKINGDSIDRGEIAIANIGDLLDRPMIAGESGPKVEARGLSGKWSVRIDKTVITRRGVTTTQFVSRQKGADYSKPSTLLRGVAFIEGFTLHLRVSAIKSTREDELKKALEAVSQRFGLPT